MIGLNTDTASLPLDYSMLPTEMTVTTVCPLCCGSGSNLTYDVGLVIGALPLCSTCGGSGVMTITLPTAPFLADLEYR